MAKKCVCCVILAHIIAIILGLAVGSLFFPTIIRWFS